MHERQRGEPLDAFRRRPPGAEDIGLLHELLYRRSAGKSVSQSGRVAHEVLDRDRPLQGFKLESAATDHADFQVGEGRDQVRHRVGEEEPSLLDHHHRGHRDNRLRHRIDAEDRVLAHRGSARAKPAQALPVGDLAVTGDQHGGAGGPFFFLDRAGHDGAQPLEPLGQEADTFGGGVGEGEGAHCGLATAADGS